MWVFSMAKTQFDEQARSRRKKALPALAIAGLMFLVFFKFDGFNLGAILSLAIFVMIFWYLITIRAKLERWANEEATSLEISKPGTKSEECMEDGQDELCLISLDEESERWVAHPRGKGHLPVIALAATWDAKNNEFLLDFGLREQAVMLSRRIDTLGANLATFLKNEALRPDLRKYAEIIPGLEVEQVSFLWPDHPEDGIVRFKAVEVDYSWACKIHRGEPIAGSLGFDT